MTDLLFDGMDGVTPEPRLRSRKYLPREEKLLPEKLDLWDYKKRGWSRSGWLERLQYYAEVCVTVNPEFAKECGYAVQRIQMSNKSTDGLTRPLNGGT